VTDLDPSDHTVENLEGELEDVDDPDVLESIREAEIGGKDRKTAKKAIQDRLDSLEDEGVIPDEEEADEKGGDDTSTYEEEGNADAEPEEADADEEDEAEEDEAEEDEGEEEEDDGLDHPTADKRHVRALQGGTYRDMWVYCENHDGELLDVSREMLGKARDLVDQYNDDYEEDERVVAVLVGSDVADLADEAIAYGADVAIYHEDDRLERFRHKPYTEIVADMARADGEWRDYDKPRYVQFPATNNGRDISAQVQAELDSGLASDCNELFIEDELISNPVKTGTPGEKVDFERILHMKRPDFSGFEWSTILCIDNPGRDFHPQGCSVIPGSFPIPEHDDEREGHIVEHDIELGDDWFRVDVTGWEELDSGVDLSGHDVVVALGRGIGDDPTRGIELGLELCETFEDAALGLSRGVVTASYQLEGHVDEYVAEERQIGETGQVVEPPLYIAAGISGAIQHKVGMNESDTIVAINTDPEAQIKDFSDYFIVGDLFEEIPRLIEALKAGELPDAVAAADGGKDD
jgi:electron transfer flavoprotein alpha subunit